VNLAQQTTRHSGKENTYLVIESNTTDDIGAFSLDIKCVVDQFKSIFFAISVCSALEMQVVHGAGYVSSRSYRQPKTYFRHTACAVSLLFVFGIALSGLFDEKPTSSTVLTNIAGIDEETKGHIDSGEWSKEAIVIDQEKGLLPPDPNQKKIASAELAGGSVDDAKKKKGGGTDDASGDGSSGGGVEGDDSADDAKGGSLKGHCQKDVHIKCSSHAQCGPLGSCVEWHCSNSSETVCYTSDDCNPYGGICTGAGYCKANHETACSKTDDCSIYEDSQCLSGGTCEMDPKVGCIQDSDCPQEGDTCTTHTKTWWEAGTNFPQDDTDFGPYAQWTPMQLRKKVLIALKKIMYMQADMEAQVPINRMLNTSIEALARRKGEILRVNAPVAREAHQIMKDKVQNATKEFKKSSWAHIDLDKAASDLNETITTTDAAQDDRVLKSLADFDALNNTINASYSLLISRMEDLRTELNDTIFELNYTQHMTAKQLQDHFQNTFNDAKAGLYKSFKEIEDMPTEDFYNGLREIRAMFHDFKVKNDRYLRTSKKIASQAIGDVDDLSVAMEQESETYYNSSVRAAIQDLLVDLHSLTANATAADPTLTGLEKALGTFEKDFPLPAS
jgi:hypothetical protein